MNFNDFEAEDFLKDETFREWVLGNNPKAIEKWDHIIDKYPGKRKEIEAAREILAPFKFKNYELPDIEKDTMWNNIEKSTVNTQFPRTNTHNSLYHIAYKVAATFSILLISSFLIYYIAFFDNEVKEYASFGEIKIVTLPDMSTVTLNANSYITFSEDWEKDSVRIVTLDGEAFFEVTHDKKKPFIVKANNLNIKVLGTSFNVKNYNNENTVQTTLISGSVSIQEIDKRIGIVRNELILKSKEQAIYYKNENDLQHANNETELVTSWKEKKLAFKDQALDEVVKSLERWYGVEFILEDKQLDKCSLTAEFKNEKLEDVLLILKKISQIDYKIINKKVFLYGQLCSN